MLPLLNRRMAQLLRGACDAWWSVSVDFQSLDPMLDAINPAALLAWFQRRPGCATSV